MIANLLIMVIVGGCETFVSRIGLAAHRDQPEWLSHVNSNVLKVKLATAIAGISSTATTTMTTWSSQPSQPSNPSSTRAPNSHTLRRAVPWRSR